MVFKSALLYSCDIAYFPEVIDDWREKRVLGSTFLEEAIVIYGEQKKSPQKLGTMGIQVFI